MSKFLMPLFVLLFTSPGFASDDPFAGIPTAVMSYHRTTNAAACLYDSDSLLKSATINSLGKDWTLYLIPCGSGAYQTNFHAYVAKPDLSEIHALLFTDWASDTGVAGADRIFEPAFSATATNRFLIRTTLVGRSIGDCGQSAVFELIVDKYGVRVKTDEIRAKENCDGNMNRWPLVYSKR